MLYNTGMIRAWIVIILLTAVVAGQAFAAVKTVDELKARVDAISKDFQDISMTANVTEVNKDALAKVEENYARLYEFKSANVTMKSPDKLRIEGKLGMVKFEYIINGGVKLFRAPKVRINKKSDYSKQPGKLQDAFDLGLMTSGFWRGRIIEIVDDPAAESEIKIKYKWPTGDTVYYTWLDADKLWIKRFEKHSSEKGLEVRIVNSEPVNVAGDLWMPTKTEMFAPDGAKAGALKMTDIKSNQGLADSEFE